jgi:integrase
MASLQKKGNSWYCQFYWRDQRFTFAVGRVTKPQAEAKATKVGEIVELLERGVLKLPDGMGVSAFVKHDGHPPAPVESQKVSQKSALGELRDAYLKAHEASQEVKTLYTAKIHLNHLVATLGKAFDLRTLELAHLQKHIDRRCPKVSPSTASKEISTFRTAWNWGGRMKLVSGPCPVKGLLYPKVDEKPPFQTRAEIERQVEGLPEEQRQELWDALYLTLPEIDAFLAIVREAAVHPWIHPLVATAAHAGLRRSELVRVRKSDVDFGSMILTVRERKRTKGKRTTRRVPLSTSLAAILREWLEGHPGGPFLFAQSEEVFRSKKRSHTTGHKNGEERPKSLKGRLVGVSARERPGILPLTIHEVSDHFRRTVNTGPWSVVPGLHCLRHSFISACASKGLDQRIIDEFVGHSTEEQRRRYRHLYPSVQAEAMKSVFG